MKRDPLIRYFSAQRLEQVPGDRFPLAVLVRRQQEFPCILKLLFQYIDPFLTVLGLDIDRLEIVLGIDAQACPRFTLYIVWDLAGRGGQIADVSVAGLNDVILTQEP